MDERVISNIVQNNVCCNNENDKLMFVIYYLNLTISSLIMETYQSPPCDYLLRERLLYDFFVLETGMNVLKVLASVLCKLHYHADLQCTKDQEI